VAVTLRFRPVVFGPPASPHIVFYLVEDAEGQVMFRELEFTWPVAASLEQVTPSDLPWRYMKHDPEVTILPPQQVIGATVAEAHERMTEAIEALSTGATKHSTAPASRHSAKSTPTNRLA
jgi:hypothetical protein